jgi:hydroxymethylglutaryl-CoA lyase
MTRATHTQPGVRIRDVAPRLAFQAHAASTADKVELVNRLVAAGVRAIEVSSFVRPDLIPGLADAAEVFARVDRVPGVSLECCVGNARGLERAVDAGADAAWFLLSADDGFARDNIGRTTDESLRELARMRTVADATGIELGTYVIFAWGGPSGPARGADELEPLARRLLDVGVTRWILADSSGYAAPPQIRELVQAAAELVGLDELTVQVHDGRGLGLADVVELVRLGVTRIDTSLAGSGGHPAMPAAQGGGVCTEDAVQLLDLLGLDAGIDLAALIDAANWLEGTVGVPAKGFVRQTGPVPTSAGELPAGSEFRWRS